MKEEIIKQIKEYCEKYKIPIKNIKYDFPTKILTINYNHLKTDEQQIDYISDVIHFCFSYLIFTKKDLEDIKE